jgi:hypothetical protein
VLHHHRYLFLMRCVHGNRAEAEFMEELAFIGDFEADRLTGFYVDLFWLVADVPHRDFDVSANLGRFAGFAELKTVMAAHMATAMRFLGTVSAAMFAGG